MKSEYVKESAICLTYSDWHVNETPIW
jgi:hypothetical protein